MNLGDKKKSDVNETPRPCDKCDNPGMWSLRAKTMFLCDNCRRKLEWERA